MPTGKALHNAITGTTGQVLTKQADGTWVGANAASGLTGQNLWEPPASPNADDDEFDSGNALNAAWTQQFTWDATNHPGAGNVDPYAGFNGTGCRWSHNSDWPSWLRLQGDPTGGRIWKPVTVGANKLIWCRCRSNVRRAQPAVAYDGLALLGLAATSGGLVDNNNRIYVALQSGTNGAVQAFARSFKGGVDSGEVVTTNIVGQGQPYEYLAIHKAGNTVHMWVGTNVNWTWITSADWTGGATLDLVYLEASANSTAAPGNSISGFDFIRFVDSAVYLP